METNHRIKQLEIDGEVDFLRQKEWLDPTKMDTGLTIVGAGGIGSFATCMASKLGINDIILYDDDTFEPHNVPNQWAKKSQVGMPKVEAVKENAEDFGIADIIPMNSQVDKYTAFTTPYIWSGLDSMEARVATWEAIKSSIEAAEVPPLRYWDARLGGELITVWSVDLTDVAEMEAFEKTLYSDGESLELPCTRRAVIDVMGYVGSFMTTGLRKAIAGDDVPGYTFFNAETMFIEHGGLIEAVEYNESTKEIIAA